MVAAAVATSPEHSWRSANSDPDYTKHCAKPDLTRILTPGTPPLRHDTSIPQLTVAPRHEPWLGENLTGPLLQRFELRAAQQSLFDGVRVEVWYADASAMVTVLNEQRLRKRTCERSDGNVAG